MTKLVPPHLYHMLGFRATGDMGPFTFYTNKKNKLVFFTKAPPTSPPTPRQSQQRNRFRSAGHYWSSLPPATRTNWELAAKRAHLRITGYNLFVHWCNHRTNDYFATIERLSGIKLLT